MSCAMRKFLYCQDSTTFTVSICYRSAGQSGRANHRAPPHPDTWRLLLWLCVGVFFLSHIGTARRHRRIPESAGHTPTGFLCCNRSGRRTLTQERRTTKRRNKQPHRSQPQEHETLHTYVAGFVGFVITVHNYSRDMKSTTVQSLRAAGLGVLYRSQLDESADLRSKTR